MKRFLTVFCLIAVLTAMAVCVTACSSDKTEDTSDTFDANKVFNSLLSDVKYAETLADNSDTAEYSFTDLPENCEIKMYTCDSGSHPDELIMMKAAAESDVEALKTAANTHIEQLIAQLRDYNPEEVSRVENAIVKTKGLYIFVCITEDVETAETVLSQGGVK